MFGEKILLFDRPKRFYLFIFVSSPRLIKFRNFPVNQFIKNTGLKLSNAGIFNLHTVMASAIFTAPCRLR